MQRSFKDVAANLVGTQEMEDAVVGDSRWGDSLPESFIKELEASITQGLPAEPLEIASHLAGTLGDSLTEDMETIIDTLPTPLTKCVLHIDVETGEEKLVRVPGAPPPGTPPDECAPTVVDDSESDVPVAPCSPTVLEESSSDRSRSGSPRRDFWLSRPGGSALAPSALGSALALAPFSHDEGIIEPITGDPELDEFMQKWEKPAVVDTPESRDPEDTDELDPMDHRQRYTTADEEVSAHWSMTDKFSRSVTNMLTMCTHEYWYQGVLTYTAEVRPLCFNDALQHAIEFIHSTVQPRGTFYKIGITGHPFQRWTRPDCPYDGNIHGFSKILILWIAPHSRKGLPESTGKMEKQLIEVFNEVTDENCINRKGAGGDAPPRGSPQFCYVVYS